MDIIVFEPDQLEVALGALRALVAEPSVRADQYLEVLARLHGHDVIASELANPTIETIERTIGDAHRRKRLVQLGTILIMVDGSVSAPAARSLTDLARVLEVDEPALRILPHLVRRNALATRAQLMPRILRILGGSAWRADGLRGVMQIVGGLLGVSHDRATAERFAMLAQYPEGTLGRALSDYLTRNGFGLPGLRGSIPERGLFHDLGHLLSGYGTDPAGEIQQAAFQAGFVRRDGFTFLFFGIIQFHLGIKITPVAAGQTGYFDIERVMTALARGASCRVDFSENLSFWELAERTLDDIRCAWGIPSTAEVFGARALA